MMMRIDEELKRELKSLKLFFSKKSKSNCLSSCSCAMSQVLASQCIGRLITEGRSSYTPISLGWEREFISCNNLSV